MINEEASQFVMGDFLHFSLAHSSGRIAVLLKGARKIQSVEKAAECRFLLTTVSVTSESLI